MNSGPVAVRRASANRVVMGITCGRAGLIRFLFFPAAAGAGWMLRPMFVPESVGLFAVARYRGAS